jgi:chromosome segregation ATPase
MYVQELEQLQEQHKQQLSSVTQKLQLAVQERGELQRLVSSFQQQLQAATDKADAAASAAGSRSSHLQQQQQHQDVTGLQPGISTQDGVLHEFRRQSIESGLAGLGLEDQETPGEHSGSRFSLANVRPRGSSTADPGSTAEAGSTAAAAAAALGSHRSGVALGGPGQGSSQLLANGSGQLLRGASGRMSQLSSASGSPMAAQARAQQLPGNLSGLLSLEGQLQLQRTVQQLQQELQAVTKERDTAAEQLYDLVRQAEAAAAAVQETEKLKQQQAELQHKVS